MKVAVCVLHDSTPWSYLIGRELVRGPNGANQMFSPDIGHLGEERLGHLDLEGDL